MMIWRQFIKIEDRVVTHRLPLFEPQDPPPKDKEFMVFQLGDRPEENTYLRKENGKVVDSITLNENVKYLQWVGLAKWSEENQWFEIETTSRTEHNGFICIPKLEQSMRFAILPYSSTWSQPNYPAPQGFKKKGLFRRILNSIT